MISLAFQLQTLRREFRSSKVFRENRDRILEGRVGTDRRQRMYPCAEQQGQEASSECPCTFKGTVWHSGIIELTGKEDKTFLNSSFVDSYS